MQNDNYLLTRSEAKETITVKTVGRRIVLLPELCEPFCRIILLKGGQWERLDQGEGFMKVFSDC